MEQNKRIRGQTFDETMTKPKGVVRNQEVETGFGFLDAFIFMMGVIYSKDANKMMLQYFWQINPADESKNNTILTMNENKRWDFFVLPISNRVII